MRYALLLIICGCAYAPVVEAPEPTLWGATCAAVDTILNYQGSCVGIEEPQVIDSFIVVDHVINLFGDLHGIYYHGEPWVFVNPTMEVDMQIRTAVHESVHYILYNLDPTISSCNGEMLARQVEAEFAGIEYTDEWRPRYGCQEE